VYSTCLFCNQSLGSNEVIERFPVGRRLAFDASKGRLWVVCVRCARWNLTPIEERHEAIEECERRYRGTYIRVSTDNIGLTRLREGLELIRIGAPLRPEFAAWRYAGEFFSRRHRSYAIAGATMAAAGAASAAIGVLLGPTALEAGAVSVLVVPGVTTMMTTIPMLGRVIAEDYWKYERVVARFSDEAGGFVNVRAKHLRDIKFSIYPGRDASISVHHDTGHAEFNGTAATHAATVIVANSNRAGASRRAVQAAVGQIEKSGTAEGYLETASRRNGWRGMRPVSVLGQYRRLGAMNLSAMERLAFEMSVHEETERRASQGELAVLQKAWRDAEEIAAICDGVLTPPS
jgi:hypothetical protein